MSFVAIERLIGRELPPSARKHAAFWSNTSSYARAWTTAGYEVTRRGLLPEQVRFVPTRRHGSQSSARSKAPTPGPSSATMPPRLRLPTPPPVVPPSRPARADQGAASQLRAAAGHLKSAFRGWRRPRVGQETTTEDRGWSPPAEPPAPSHSMRSPEPGSRADVVLVGCVKSKQPHAAPAKDIYTSALFRGARKLAEASGVPWFILSAEHGLLQPNEVIEPYDVYLKTMPTAYQRDWGRRVVEHLLRAIGPVEGRRIEVYASDAYVSAIRQRLKDAGAVVVEPIAGLRMGERLQWYASHRQEREEQDPPAEEPPTDWPRPGGRPVSRPTGQGTRPAEPGSASSETAHLAGNEKDVAAAILRYRAEHLDNRSRAAFAETTEATDLIHSDPFAFLLGVIFDEGITAERAWQAPHELRERVGTLDPRRLRNMAAEVRGAVATPRMLHRYKEIMAEATVRAAAKVCDDYDGDAARIWAPGSTAREVADRFLAFYRIGDKKANMAVELLFSDLGVVLEDMHRSDVAYDVHVRRVFMRTGLAERDSSPAVWAAARRLHPARPGELDLPTWFIGRSWCHATNPDHVGCPLDEVCPKLTSRADRIR